MCTSFDLDDPDLLELARSSIDKLQAFQIRVPGKLIVTLSRSTSLWRMAEEATGFRRTLAWIRAYTAAFGLRQYWMAFVLARSKGFEYRLREIDGVQFVQFFPEPESARPSRP